MKAVGPIGPTTLEVKAMATVEERLTELEAKVTRLAQCMSDRRENGNWIDAIIGSFRDDPEFEEILRLGREIRRQDYLIEPLDDSKG